MHEWAVIADDLTGACDTGVAFARRGWAARVAFSAGADFRGAQVRVITTESRELSEQEAAQAVRLAAEAAAAAAAIPPVGLVYKKIDSTLRGHPGVELRAVMDALGISRALVCPAFPEQGRTVSGGRVWVNGEPLEQTAFGSQIRQPDLLRLFDGGGGMKCRGIPCRPIALEIVLEGPGRVAEALAAAGVFAADAETAADLQTLARAGLRAGLRLFCGSAGLARALVEELPPGPLLAEFAPRPAPVLALAGSRSPVTLRQVEAARQAGTQVICPRLADLRIASRMILDQVSGTLLQGQNVVLSVAGLERLPQGEAEIAAALAQLAAGTLARAQVGGLVLTGGDTATAVCRALNCMAVDLGGEVRPGIVWGSLAEGSYAGLTVVTKAGGFGDDEALVNAIQFIRG